MEKMKVALVSAILGGFDKPKPVMEQSHPYDYFMFDENSGFLFREELTTRIRAKFFKYQQHHIHELKPYDIYIWIDGSILIKSPNFIEYMVRQLQGHDIAITNHNKRDCLFAEGKYIIEDNGAYLASRYGKEKELMKQQMVDYKKAGMPENWGLFCCGLFARKNTPEVNRVMDLIWIDNIRYASQDQNPFPFYCWQYNMKLNRLPLDICRNHFWELKPHV